MKNPPKNQKVMGKKADVEKTLGGKRKIRKAKRDADDLEKQRLRQVIAESDLLLNKIEGKIYFKINHKSDFNILNSQKRFFLKLKTRSESFY